jgi:hypothetical protein
LQPVFFPLSPGNLDAGAIEITDDEALQVSVRKLAAFALASDRAITAALTSSNGQHSSSSIKSVEFWRSLTTAEKIAAKIGVYH